MENRPLNPQVYEINTRVWLNTLSAALERRLTLGAVPQDIWEHYKELGMDAVWLMGVWLPSAAGVQIARNHPDLLRAYGQALPDFVPDDVIGSPYSVAGYELNPALGGPDDLARVRENLRRAGLKLILDFVPNHTAQDHPWVREFPRYYVWDDADSMFGHADSFEADTAAGKKVRIAFGRDPYFAPWTDTAQMCAICSETREAVSRDLVRIVDWCDGLRCDMAMLTLNSVFGRTWKAWIDRRGVVLPPTEYWAEVMTAVKASHPEFVFMAEAYWGTEPELLNLGFDYVYDKEGYDQLRCLDMSALKRDLLAEGDRKTHKIRFLENHDEDRMASAFRGGSFFSAAVIHATLPGLRLFHHGQLEGRVIKLPVQLGREPEEPLDEEIESFYDRLLRETAAPLFKDADGRVLDVEPSFEGDASYASLIAVAYLNESEAAVAAVNHSDRTASCYARFPAGFWDGWEDIVFHDVMSEEKTVYARKREALEKEGLYIKLGSFGYHLLRAARKEGRP